MRRYRTKDVVRDVHVMSWFYSVQIPKVTALGYVQGIAHHTHTHTPSTPCRHQHRPRSRTFTHSYLHVRLLDPNAFQPLSVGPIRMRPVSSKVVSLRSMSLNCGVGLAAQCRAAACGLRPFAERGVVCGHEIVPRVRTQAECLNGVPVH